MARDAYRKLFIFDVHRKTLGEVQTSIKQMKTAVIGIVISIKVYQEKLLFTVDDGTGMLDCIIKMKECFNGMQIPLMKQELTRGDSCSSEIKGDMQGILNKLETNIQISNELFCRGDLVIAFGHVFMLSGKPCLEVSWHEKVIDPNVENLWKMQQFLLYNKGY